MRNSLANIFISKNIRADGRPSHVTDWMEFKHANRVYLNGNKEMLFLYFLNTTVIDTVSYLLHPVYSYLLHFTRQWVVEQMV